MPGCRRPLPSVLAAACAALATSFAATAGTGGLADHDDSYVYRLPYADDASFEVLQAYGSHFSHRGTEYYTLDFLMAEGTPVLSARDGIVTEVESTHHRSCFTDGCDRLANRVVIRHSDGTYALYFHLAPGSVAVERGQHIRRGDQLALSGNTGFTTTPHLHFGVYVRGSDAELQSIPVRFATSDGPVELRQGRRYRNPVIGARVANAPDARLEPQDAKL